MKILAIEQTLNKHPASDCSPYLAQEVTRVLELYEQGMIREIYFNQHHDAVIIVECADLHEARAILKTLPLVAHGLITFELMELRPFDEFSKLVNK